MAWSGPRRRPPRCPRSAARTPLRMSASSSAGNPTLDHRRTDPVAHPGQLVHVVGVEVGELRVDRVASTVWEMKRRKAWRWSRNRRAPSPRPRSGSPPSRRVESCRRPARGRPRPQLGEPSDVSVAGPAGGGRGGHPGSPLEGVRRRSGSGGEVGRAAGWSGGGLVRWRVGQVAGWSGGALSQVAGWACRDCRITVDISSTDLAEELIDGIL